MAVYCIKNSDDITKLTKYLATVYPKANAVKRQILVEVTEHRPDRTKDQNAYYWLVNKAIADCLNKAGCTYGDLHLPYSKDLVHTINKSVFGLESTKDMSIHDFCDFMTKTITFWQERTNNNIRLPELPEDYFITRGYNFHYLERN